MPLLKDGSFLLDDSSCDPYGTINTREKTKNTKGNKLGKPKNTAKKSGVGKKK